MRIGGVKLAVDGGFEGGHFRDAYAEPFGKGGTFRGITTFPPDEYKAAVTQLNRDGWTIATHAVGDAAVDQVLDAYAAADAEKPIGDRRFAIEHAFDIHPEQIAEMQRLKIVASIQDHLYLAAPAMAKFWGPRACRPRDVREYVLKERSDRRRRDPIPRSSPSIRSGKSTISHRATRSPAGVFGADEKVESRQALLRMITINFARMIGAQDVRGSIEPGKLADFAVLSSDLLTAPLPAVRDTKALATYVGGRQVYRDGASDIAAQTP